MLNVIGPFDRGTEQEEGSVELRPTDEEPAAEAPTSDDLAKNGGVSKLRLIGGFSTFGQDKNGDEDEYIVQSEQLHDEAWRQVSVGA